MKDNANILAWLMLLVYLLTWSLLHVAPQDSGTVVYKKFCKREIFKTSQLAQQRHQANTISEEQQAPNQPIELKLCQLNLAAPPPALTVAFAAPAPQALLPVYKPPLYCFSPVPSEPDPPRSA